jgi:hypothetical protein
MEDKSDLNLVEKIKSAALMLQRDLTDFVCSHEFKSMLLELGALPEHLKHEFVEFVLLDSDQLKLRGIRVPDGIQIQRSYFADQRPTLFCVTKKVPKGLFWEKITITFDNETVGLAKPSFACDGEGNLLPFLQPPSHRSDSNSGDPAVV